MLIERRRRGDILRMVEKSQFDILLHILDLENIIGYPHNTYVLLACGKCVLV